MIEVYSFVTHFEIDNNSYNYSTLRSGGCAVYSQSTSVLEAAGSIPAPVIIEFPDLLRCLINVPGIFLSSSLSSESWLATKKWNLFSFPVKIKQNAVC